MYDINTRLSSLMMAQGAQTAHFAGTPFQDLRAQIEELEAQREKDKATHLEVKEKVFLLLSPRFFEWSLMATCPRLPPSVCL